MNGDIDNPLSPSVILPETMAPTIAQQTYIVASGIAGGAAGMVLAYYLVGKTKVPTKVVVSASILSVLFTFIPAMIIAKEAQ